MPKMMMRRAIARAFGRTPVWPLLLAAGLFFLAFLPCRGEIPCVFTGVDKIVAVGDLHGDYRNFVKILTQTHIVGEDLHWIAGRTHLVQVGDILDRGPAARKIFDLLMRLEQEAVAAGGRVHVLMGNHEEMALEGISFDYPGFVTVEEFLSFLPDAYIDQKQTEFVKEKAARLPAGSDPPLISLSELMDYWTKLMTEKEDARQEYFRSLYDLYGPWLLSHNAVIKINDVVFAHGGISERFSRMPLEEINKSVRDELGLAMRRAHFNPIVIFQPDNPLWYRDLALNDEYSMGPDVDRILRNLKAAHMVVGHSPRNLGVRRGRVDTQHMKRFEGKIWVIDTGISSVYGSHLSALIIANGNFKPWGVDDAAN